MDACRCARGLRFAGRERRFAGRERRFTGRRRCQELLFRGRTALLGRGGR